MFSSEVDSWSVPFCRRVELMQTHVHSDVNRRCFAGWVPHHLCHPAPWNPPWGELVQSTPLAFSTCGFLVFRVCFLSVHCVLVFRWETLPSCSGLDLTGGAPLACSCPRRPSGSSVPALRYVLTHRRAQVSGDGRVRACGSRSGLYCWWKQSLQTLAENATAWILPFTAGGFLYIALVNVVPELLQESSLRYPFLLRTPWGSLRRPCCHVGTSGHSSN